MDSILFEKQEASLCAQHALNMLIQDHLFSVHELSEIARRLDRAENGILDTSLQNKESQNMNDSGYFSIQVIAEALKAFDLELHNIEHPSMEQWKRDPVSARAFLCNHAEHWFVLRRFGTQWFELNSIKNGPRLLSDTYVGVFLHQLRAEEYTIFVVQGILPESEADQLISLCPVEAPPALHERKEPNVVQKLFNSVGKRLGGGLMMPSSSDSQEDRELAIAMAMSMETSQTEVGERSDIDADISAAIEASLADFDKKVEEEKGPSSSGPVVPVDEAETTEKIESPDESEKALETPILHSTSQTSINEQVDENVTETPKETGITPSVEQQRKDREAFLKRLEKSD